MQTIDDDQFRRSAAAAKFMACYNEANHSLQRRQYDEAIRLYDAACSEWAKELFGSSREAHNAMGALCWSNRGIALQRVGRLEEAIESYKRAIELVPGYTDATCNLELVKRHPQPSNSSDVQHFIANVVAGRPAKCRINISDFQNVYQALTESMRNAGFSASDITYRIWSSFTSVCPRCECSIDGRNLGQLDVITSIGLDRVTLRGPGRAIRFIRDGLCLNPECSAPEITLCWQP